LSSTSFSANSNDLPVRVPHGCERRRDRAPELDFGNIAVDRRHPKLLPGVVDEKSSQQRLRERQVEVGREGRIEISEDVRRDLLPIVELERHVTAAPRQGLQEPGVVIGGVELHDGAAVQLVRRGLRDRALIEL
jgi:hypothetical protein